MAGGDGGRGRCGGRGVWGGGCSAVLDFSNPFPDFSIEVSNDVNEVIKPGGFILVHEGVHGRVVQAVVEGVECGRDRPLRLACETPEFGQVAGEVVGSLFQDAQRFHQGRGRQMRLPRSR